MVHVEGLAELVIGFAFMWLLIFTSVAAAIRVNRPRVRPADARVCPHCRESIHKEATVCRHCGRESPRMEFREGRWWTADAAGNAVWLNPETGRWESGSPG